MSLKTVDRLKVRVHETIMKSELGKLSYCRSLFRRTVASAFGRWLHTRKKRS